MNQSIENARLRPRRTMIYVSADIDRHMEKAGTLPTDTIIYDLHESVSAQYKSRARAKLRNFLETAGSLGQERVLRVNPLESPWIEDDLKEAAKLPLDALMFTGLDCAEEVQRAERMMDAAGAAHLPMMAMIESPLAVLNVQQIAGASQRLACLAVSNANLMTSMRLPPSQDRTGLFTSLSMVVLAARAYGLSVVDGAHLDITDPHACEYACRQSRDFGFDGKAVIHPAQLAYTNDAFTPKPKDVKRKRKIIRLMEEAHAAGRSYAVMDSRLLQPSELQAAKRCLALHQAIQERTQALGGERKADAKAAAR